MDMKSKHWIRWQVALQIALVIWIVWVVNAWAFRHSWRIDLTRDQRYVIAPETKDFLRTLPKRVDIVVPYSFGPGAKDRLQSRILRRAIRTIEEFELVNPYCRLAEEIDIVRDPLRWQQRREELGLDQPNRLYLIAGDRRELVTLDDLAVLSEDPEAPEILRERVPEALAAALERVVLNDAPRVLLTTGHGESSLGDDRPNIGLSEFRRDLQDRGFQIETVDLRQGGVIPAGIDVLIVIAGSMGSDLAFEPFAPDARAEVIRYHDGGGSLFLLLPFDGLSGLESICESAGITAGHGIVHSASSTQGVGAIRVAEYLEGHPITDRFESGADFVEIASFRPLLVTDEAEALVSSSADSWLEIDIDGRQAADEPAGPFVVAAISQAEEGGKLAVFGSWTPVLDVFHRGHSRRLLLLTLDWLTDREGPAAGVGRVDSRDRVDLTPEALSALSWISIVFLPGSVVVLGTVVWTLRRRLR